MMSIDKVRVLTYSNFQFKCELVKAMVPLFPDVQPLFVIQNHFKFSYLFRSWYFR